MKEQLKLFNKMVRKYPPKTIVSLKTSDITEKYEVVEYYLTQTGFGVKIQFNDYYSPMDVCYSQLKKLYQICK